jgi:hypothetical protein
MLSKEAGVWKNYQTDDFHGTNHFHREKGIVFKSAQYSI